ncbi:hypothetical protein GW17_00040019 [Ensete ventricosum]|nr:hypothetical protein GW17_00040019 [Ensete ventricosum]
MKHNSRTIRRLRQIRIGRAAPDSRFSLFFSLFFFVPRLILPKIDRQWSKSTITARQRPTTVEIDRYRPISGGNGAKTTPTIGTAW